MGTVRENGLVIKQKNYGNGNIQMNIFTENYGILHATNFNAKRQKNKFAASSQFLSFGEVELYFNRDYVNINSFDVSEAFLPAAEDIVKLSLCTYLSDITYAMLGENNPDNRILKNLLNSFYAIAYRNEPLKKIKAVYELRLMTLGGYMPNLEPCDCGENKFRMFDLDKGSMGCKKCCGYNSIRMTEGLYKAMNYIINAEDKKVLAFRGNDVLLDELGIAAEKYLLAHIDKKFPSLEYYKNIKNIRI